MKSSFAISNLSVSYGDRSVLHELSVDIPQGKVTTLIGPNGCGKSTLLNSLCGLMPYQRSITYEDTPIMGLRSRERARRIALLPQSPTAPEHMTVFQLVARGRHPHQSWFSQWSAQDELIVRQALRAVGMECRAGSELQHLSGGQRRRAWIAMALAQDTPTILLDEPTTYLDLAHSIEVLRIVRGLCDRDGKTIVMVLHDVNLAIRYSDILLAMEADGSIAAVGTPWDVISAEMLRRTFGLRAIVVNDPETGGPLVVPRKDY